MSKDNPPVRGGMSSDEEEELGNKKKMKWSDQVENVIVDEIYEVTDIGPFKVNIEYIESTDYNYLTTLKTGQILKDKLNIKEVVDIKRFSKKTVVVYLNNCVSANALVKSQEIKKYNIRSYIPKSYTCVSGVIKNVDFDIDLTGLKNEINLTMKCMDITRLTKLDNTTNERIDTKAVKVLFRRNTIPNEVVAYKTILKISPMFSQLRQCTRCLRFGHKTEHCKSSKAFCVKCGEIKHEGQCLLLKLKCFHCKKEHRADDINCEEKTRQKNIKFLMAKYNMGYFEAVEKHPTHTHNYFNLLENGEDFPQMSAPKGKNLADIIKQNNKPFDYKINNTQTQQQQKMTKATKPRPSVNYRMENLRETTNVLSGPSYKINNRENNTFYNNNKPTNHLSTQNIMMESIKEILQHLQSQSSSQQQQQQNKTQNNRQNNHNPTTNDYDNTWQMETDQETTRINNG